jgi:hypothetical protein
MRKKEETTSRFFKVEYNKYSGKERKISKELKYIQVNAIADDASKNSYLSRISK